MCSTTGGGGTLNRKLAHKRLIVSSLVQVQLQGGLGFQFGVQLGAPVPILASLLFGLPDRTELGQVAPSQNRCFMSQLFSSGASPGVANSLPSAVRGHEPLLKMARV